MSAEDRCQVCGLASPVSFLRLDGVPIHQNLLMRSREEALACDTGRLDVVVCRECGFISNASFEPARLQYSPQYENSQSCSPGFRAYLEEVAWGLIARHGLCGKRILEIGCGNADFLKLICELGPNRGVGFDPSFDRDRVQLPNSIVVFAEAYSARYVECRADLVCFRHTLEHISNPASFVGQLRQLIGDHETAVFCEVPDVTWILERLAFWDFFYEHCNYFSPVSLSRLFGRHRFGSVEIRRAFGDQYLWLDARPSRGGSEAVTNARAGEVKRLIELVDRFSIGYQRRIEELREQVFESISQGHRTVVWGAGAKGVTLLNLLGVGPEVVELVVDVNPRKQGQFIPGTGQRIVSPDALVDQVPDTVLVVNDNYLAEIGERLSDLRLSPRLIAL